MNSNHAEIILKLMRFLESFSEIAQVHGSFQDSVGGERLHCKFTLEIKIDAKRPKEAKP